MSSSPAATCEVATCQVVLPLAVPFGHSCHSTLGISSSPAATSHTRSDQYRPPPTLSRTARCPVVCRPPLAAPLQSKPLPPLTLAAACRPRPPTPCGTLAAPLAPSWPQPTGRQTDRQRNAQPKPRTPLTPRHPLGRRRHARRAGAHHRDRQAGAEAGAGQAGGAQRARVRRGEEGRQIRDLATNYATMHSTSSMVLTPQIG